MISAMPAVAIRNARRKMFRVPKSHSQSSSLSSLNLSILKRHGLNHKFRYKNAANERDLLRKRVLIYLGTFFLVAGLLLVFIGVGANVPTAKTVGLVLIGVGTTFCMIKVFYSEAQMTKIITKVPNLDESEDSADNLTAARNTASRNKSIPVIEVTEFTALPVSLVDKQDPAGTISNNQKQTNNSVTPNSKNDIAEIQVLIPESSEKYCIKNM